MIISDLDHLKTIVEAPSVVGGYRSAFYEDLLVWLESDPAFQGDVAQTQTEITQLTDPTTGKVTGEAIAASGQNGTNGVFAFAGATITEPQSVDQKVFQEPYWRPYQLF